MDKFVFQPVYLLLELLDGPFSKFRHLSESLIKLIRDSLEFLLLMDKFVFQPVYLLLEFLDGPFSKFSSSLSLFKLSRQVLDLFFVRLFSLICFLFRDLKGFQVITNNSQFFLKLNDFMLRGISA